MLMNETTQVLQYLAGIWRSSTTRSACIGCSHPWFHCLSRQPSLSSRAPCTCHHVFSVGWDLLLHRFFRQTPFCKDVVLLAILPGHLHSFLDHVHRLYPVELTEFVDDITHKVEGTRDAVMRVFTSQLSMWPEKCERWALRSRSSRSWWPLLGLLAEMCSGRQPNVT